MDENVRYNMRRTKNNVDCAISQMNKALKILKSDINLNGTALENKRINNAIYYMRIVSNSISWRI